MTHALTPPDATVSDAAVVDHARAVLAAHGARRQIAPLTQGDPDLDLPRAYRVAAEVRALRIARGERAVGRKVGFTNTLMWDAYGVRAPIWGTVYDATRIEAAGLTGPLSLAPFIEPRIEPEIVFGLARAPRPGMDVRALIACVDWVAPGFEIVQSLFPGWRFRAPDTVAAFGLHGALVLGPRATVAPGDAAAWIAALAEFEVALLVRPSGSDGEAAGETVADTGRARNVLGGGPLAALAHLVAMLASDPAAPPLAAGEIISTGTLTDALPVAAGQTWRLRLDGLPLSDLALAVA